MLRRLIYCLMLLGLLAGCQNNGNDPLPTALDLNSIATADAASTLTTLPTATSVSRAPTLPPTWTPSPIPTETTLEPTSTASPVPEGFSGTIYYITNSDSIVALSPDTGDETVIVNFGIGKAISNLTISPDKDLLAFIAPGNGSANEVYISDREGNYLQQVSCLGFADVRALTWSPDGNELAFYAAQAPGIPLNIYAATWEGSNTCPEGNNQRQLAEINTLETASLAYNDTGTTLYFTDGKVFALNLRTGRISDALTTGSLQGSDYGLSYQAPSKLVYIQPDFNSTIEQQTGSAYILDVNTRMLPIIPEFAAGSLAQRVEWKGEELTLLVSSLNSVLTFNAETGTSRHILGGLLLPPLATYSPDYLSLAFINADPVERNLQQIYTMRFGGFDPVQRTFHTEGTISDLIWAP